MSTHQKIKRRKPKRQTEWFPAPPPPPPLPEHLVPDVPVIEEEEIIAPVVVEHKEEPPIKDDGLEFVPNLTLATRRDPDWFELLVPKYDWKETIERMDYPPDYPP